MKRAVVLLCLLFLCGCSAQTQAETSPLSGKWYSGNTVIELSDGTCSVMSSTDIPALTYCADESSITFFADIGSIYERVMGMSESDLLAQGYISAADLAPFRICYRYTLSGSMLTLTPDRQRSSPGAFDDLSPLVLHAVKE